MYRQYRNFHVCQVCGHWTTPGQWEEAGWLVSPLYDDPSVNVVRCPLHISEWALRRSQAGRTVYWRKRMAEGKRRIPPPIPPHMSPFPIHDEPID